MKRKAEEGVKIYVIVYKEVRRLEVAPQGFPDVIAGHANHDAEFFSHEARTRGPTP